jgi:putative peptide zinc metalloprotease protein
MATLLDAPARAEGVQLIGEMVGSGYRTPPALVRRSDGQVMQLTPLLFLVLKATDGRRSCADIADAVGCALGRGVTEADVRTLIDEHLRPLGLLTCADGSEPDLKKSDPLIGLSFRKIVTNPRTTHRLTDPFRILFRAFLATPVFLAFVAVVAWVFFDRGLAASAYDAFERPHLLLLVFVVSVLSGGFHEFGHAAAARYSGAEPGAMGAGFYLVWPAFYTDVTDSYRLGRAGRIRTDLGGLYFNAIVVVLTFVWWWATGWEALLLLVATQVLQMAQQLLPLLRFDGYHVLADLAGVPDLYQRIRPTLLGLLPHRWKSPENRMIKPWSRAVITLWVLVTIPMMALMLLALITAVPRVLGTAGSVVRADAKAVADAWGTGAAIDVAGHALQMLGVILPIVAGAMILARVGMRFFAGLARWSRGSLGRRAVALVLSSVVVTAVSWAWWPHPGTYRPIDPGEQDLFTTVVKKPHTAPVGYARPAVGQGSAVVAARVGTAAEDRLAGDEPLVAAFEEGQRLPTRRHPQLAMVLVPAGGVGSDEADSGDTSTGGSIPAPDQPWVFPFGAPLPPEEGDNQALAVNTTDGSVTYDVAFALVWADGNEVLNVNEAYAYASCTDCTAVAVAFQVVLIMDDAQVIVPQNLAVAANYDCYSCITAAIASQLVLTVSETPGEEQLHALVEVWGQLTAFAQSIGSFSLGEIAAQLEGFKTQIMDILDAAPPIDTEPATTRPSDSPTSSATPSTGEPTPSTGEPTPSTTGGSTSPTPSTSPTSSSATGTPSATQSSATPPPSSSPTQSTSPTPSTTPAPTTSSGTGDAGSSSVSPSQ